jgi:hypothetical protein
VGSTISKDVSSFHLCPHKLEYHMAFLEGHLTWPVLGTVARLASQARTRTPPLQPPKSRPATAGGGAGRGQP